MQNERVNGQNLSPNNIDRNINQQNRQITLNVTISENSEYISDSPSPAQQSSQQNQNML